MISNSPEVSNFNQLFPKSIASSATNCRFFPDIGCLRATKGKGGGYERDNKVLVDLIPI